jgi:DNA-binding MarR family transcriptional regulator
MTTGPTATPGDEAWSCVAVKLGRLIERRMQAALAPYGITPGQFIALNHVAQNRGISRADLARALCISPQAVGGLVDQLTRQGLLDRSPSQPGRPIALSLTRAGRLTLNRATPAVQEFSRDLLLQCVKPGSVTTVEYTFRHVLIRLSSG